jgi:hypothetical protein
MTLTDDVKEELAALYQESVEAALEELNVEPRAPNPGGLEESLRDKILESMELVTRESGLDALSNVTGVDSRCSGTLEWAPNKKSAFCTTTHSTQAEQSGSVRDLRPLPRFSSPADRYSLECGLPYRVSKSLPTQNTPAPQGGTPRSSSLSKFPARLSGRSPPQNPTQNEEESEIG